MQQQRPAADSRRAQPDHVEGKEASFLAGGEFPFPTLTTASTGGAVSPVVTVQFKKFGIQLDFTPTVMPSGAIHLRVAPEVSSLDFTNGVTLQGFMIPAIASRRRAETEVVLREERASPSQAAGQPRNPDPDQGALDWRRPHPGPAIPQPFDQEIDRRAAGGDHPALCAAFEPRGEGQAAGLPRAVPSPVFAAAPPQCTERFRKARRPRRAACSRESITARYLPPVPGRSRTIRRWLLPHPSIPTPVSRRTFTPPTRATGGAGHHRAGGRCAGGEYGHADDGARLPPALIAAQSGRDAVQSLRHQWPFRGDLHGSPMPVSRDISTTVSGTAVRLR